MNKQQTEWLEAYIDSGDARKATKLIYTDVKESGIAAKTGYLKTTLANEIDNHAREQYKKETPLMLNVIKEIALNCEQPAVKLKAADTWLSRAGHDAVQVVELKETATHEQLLERLKIAMTGLPQELINTVLPNILINELKGKDDAKQCKESQRTH